MRQPLRDVWSAERCKDQETTGGKAATRQCPPGQQWSADGAEGAGGQGDPGAELCVWSSAAVANWHPTSIATATPARTIATRVQVVYRTTGLIVHLLPVTLCPPR